MARSYDKFCSEIQQLLESGKHRIRLGEEKLNALVVGEEREEEMVSLGQTLSPLPWR